MEGRILVKQINLHHCKAATLLIGNHFAKMYTKQSQQKLIVLIQEPYILKNRVEGFDKQHCEVYYNINPQFKQRTCIVTSKNLLISLMPQFCSGDLTTILLNTGEIGGGEELILSSMYLAHDSIQTIPGELVQETCAYSQDSGIPLILGGDANAHHTIWGSTDINTRGEDLLGFIASNNLEIMNKGTEPTFVNKIIKQVLDITLVSQEIQTRVHNWHVSPEITLSDHREINFILDYNTEPDSLFRNPRKTDWTGFTEHVQIMLQPFSDFDDINSPKELDVATRILSDTLRTAFYLACPGRVHSPNKSHWWNSKLKHLKKQTRRLRRIYDASKTNEAKSLNWSNFSKARDDYIKEIHDSKKANWIKFCEELEGEAATAKLHRLLAKDTGNKPGMLKYSDGQYTSTSKESATYLLQTHFPGCELVTNDANDNGIERNQTLSNENVDLTLLNKIVNISTTKWALDSFKPYKSPGCDNIFPVMLGKVWDLIGTRIVNIYKASIRLGYVPLLWQKNKCSFHSKTWKS